MKEVCDDFVIMQIFTPKFWAKWSMKQERFPVEEMSTVNKKDTNVRQ